MGKRERRRINKEVETDDESCFYNSIIIIIITAVVIFKDWPGWQTIPAAVLNPGLADGTYSWKDPLEGLMNEESSLRLLRSQAALGCPGRMPGRMNGMRHVLEGHEYEHSYSRCMQPSRADEVTKKSSTSCAHFQLNLISRSYSNGMATNRKTGKAVQQTRKRVHIYVKHISTSNPPVKRPAAEQIGSIFI